MVKINWILKKIVEVEWVDACSRGRWDSHDSYVAQTALNCKTSGYLAKETKKEIVIIQNQSEENSVLDSITIPRVCIQHIRRIK